jgi:hypothetical protein
MMVHVTDRPPYGVLAPYWCLDHVIPLDAAPLRALPAEYVGYYNRDRPHRTLRLAAPQPRDCAGAVSSQSVRSRPVLGGLHHAYERAA